MQLAPYGPGGDLLIMDVYVVTTRVLPKLQAQRPWYLRASAGGAISGWLEGRHGSVTNSYLS